MTGAIAGGPLPRLLGSILLAAQLALAATGLVVWRWTPDAPAAPPSLAGAVTPVVRPATLESGRAVAEARAAAWLPGARLLSATMQVDWPWDPPPPGPAAAVPGTGWLTYVFVAPWQPPGRPPGAASLSILVERLSGQVYEQSTLGWEHAPALPPPAPPPAITATQAVLAAEAAGGTGFRRACPVNRHLTRVSLVTGPEPPAYWLVTYQDTRQPERHGLIVRVDAATATILGITSDAPSCDTASSVRWGPRSLGPMLAAAADRRVV